MKQDIGKTIQKIRINKGIKIKELSNSKLSTSQISNIENGLQMPSADKLIMILGKLNVKYDEFIFLMSDEYLNGKIIMEKKLAEFVKRQNTNGLMKLATEASAFYEKYNDIFFQHINQMSLAMSHLIQNNNDYDGAREYLRPITEYLSNIDEWGYYELLLISNCLFMFEIETAVFLGEKALKFIEKNYSFYKNEGIGCVALTNIAVYSLDYSEYYHFALKYSQICINLAATSNDATRALHAKIIHQIACFKLENGLFDKNYLLLLIKTFELLGWQNEYQRVKKFVQKHGISFTSSS